MNIGLIGFGGVGKALIKLFIDKNNKMNEDICLKYIINSKGGLYNKEGLNLNEVIDIIQSHRSLQDHCDWINGLSINNIVENNDIDLMVELTSTNIETGEPGLTHIKKALSNKISVVTGNKGPILKAYNELNNLADINEVDLKIGCTTGGALPSINGGLIECAGSDIFEIQGILNGTTNYILSMMLEENVDYNFALKKAQEYGIAEANPKLDVEGFDTAAKILILSNAILGSNLSIDDISIEGITNVSIEKIKKVKDENLKLKLVGKAIKHLNNVEVRVQLEEVNSSHPLYNVDFKNKGVLYKTDTLGDISIIGGASGTTNAAASILRDIINVKIRKFTKIKRL